MLPPDGAVRDGGLSGRASPAGVAGPRLVRLDGSLDGVPALFPTPTTSLWHMLKLDRLFPRSRRFGRYNLTYLDPDA